MRQESESPLVGYRFPLGRRKLHALLAIGQCFTVCPVHGDRVCGTYVHRDSLRPDGCANCTAARA